MRLVVLIIGLFLGCATAKAQEAALSSKAHSEGQIVNDLRQGQWNTFDSTGHLISTATYVNGKLNGDYIEYSSYTAQPIVEGQYINNQKVGKWFYYNSTTAFVDKILIYRNGVIIKKA